MSRSWQAPEQARAERLTGLRALERRFRELGAEWGAPERQALWPELAAWNAEVGNLDEAALCWLNALWEADLIPPHWVSRWYGAEWGVPAHQVSDEALLAALGADGQPRERFRRLLPYLLWAGTQPAPPSPLARQHGALAAALEGHEGQLPVRAAWLAWRCLARDWPDRWPRLQEVRLRLLTRLSAQGLDPVANLPTLVRAEAYRPVGSYPSAGSWLLRLHERALGWVRPADTPHATALTPAYTTLYFAYGLARLGEKSAGTRLREQASEGLSQRDDAHRFLARAFGYRIEQALNGQRPGGPLPADELAALEGMERLSRYVVDRLRKHSRILEPDQVINPYRHSVARISEFEGALAKLTDLTDRNEVASRIEKLLREVPKGAKGNEQRARVLLAGLEAAPRVGEEFARRLLDQAIPAYDALPEAKEITGLVEQATFLEKALFAAGHFGCVEQGPPLVARFQRLLQAQKGAQALTDLDALVAQCFRGLRKLGMRDEIDQLLRQMTDLVLEGQDVKSVDFKKREQGTAALRALLHVAAGWYTLGREGQAEPILQAARGVLLASDRPTRDQTPLACAYASCLGWAPLEIAAVRLEELFQRLGGVRDNYTTADHFSVFQLDVVEAVVLAAVGAANHRLNRWLEEEEALIRRRIHHDVRVAEAAAGGCR
jgi:hypothetical protein